METTKEKQLTYKIKVEFDDETTIIFRKVKRTDFNIYKLNDEYYFTSGNFKIYRQKGNVLLGEEVPYKSLIVLTQNK